MTRTCSRPDRAIHHAALPGLLGLLLLVLVLVPLGSGCGGGDDKPATNNDRRRRNVVDVPPVTLTLARDELRRMAHPRSSLSLEVRIGALLGLAELSMQDEETLAAASAAIRAQPTPSYRRVGARVGPDEDGDTGSPDESGIGEAEAGFRIFESANGRGVKELIRFLQEPSTTEAHQARAARALGVIGPGAVEVAADVIALAELESTPLEVRLELLRTAGRIGRAAEMGIERLLQLSTDEDPAIALAAMRALAAAKPLSTAAGAAVRDRFPDLHGDLALAAADVLALHGGQKSLLALAEAMQRDDDRDRLLPRTAADGLLRADATAARWAALETLKKAAAPVCRTAAWHVLSRLPDEVVNDDVRNTVQTGLGSSSRTNREGAAPIALARGIGTMDSWFKCLGEDAPALQRTAARGLIAQNGDRALPNLRRMVAADNPVYVRGALLGLATLGRKALPALETVVGILGDPNRTGEVRALAVDVIAAMQPEVPEPAVTRLLRRLRDASGELEARIIEVLGELPLTAESRDQIVKRLEAMPEEEEEVVRRAAVNVVASRFEDRVARLLAAWRSPQGHLLATDEVARVAEADAAFRQALLERIGEDPVALGVFARMAAIPADITGTVVQSLPVSGRNDETLAVLTRLDPVARNDHIETIVRLAIKRPEVVDDPGWLRMLGQLDADGLGAALSTQVEQSTSQTLDPEPEVLAALTLVVRLGPAARGAAQALYSIVRRGGASFEIRDPGVSTREGYRFPYRALCAWGLGATMSADSPDHPTPGGGDDGAEEDGDTDGDDQ